MASAWIRCLERHRQFAAEAQAVVREHGEDRVEHGRERTGLVRVAHVAHNGAVDIFANFSTCTSLNGVHRRSSVSEIS